MLKATQFRLHHTLQGSNLIPGARRFLAWCAATGKNVLFLTNNSKPTPRELQAKLKRMGLDLPEGMDGGLCVCVCACVRVCVWVWNVLFLTNNSKPTPRELQAKRKRMGLDLPEGMHSKHTDFLHVCTEHRVLHHLPEVRLHGLCHCRGRAV